MKILLPAALEQTIRELDASGLRALLVGGAVRDALLANASAPFRPKNFDIEVYGISYERLSEFLSLRGRVDLVGQSFGVVKFTPVDSDTYDFSVPRRDNKTGRGHRDFLSTFDESIT